MPAIAFRFHSFLALHPSQSIMGLSYSLHAASYCLFCNLIPIL